MLQARAQSCRSGAALGVALLNDTLPRATDAHRYARAQTPEQILRAKRIGPGDLARCAELGAALAAQTKVAKGRPLMRSSAA